MEVDYYSRLLPSLFDSPIAVSLRVEKPISNVNRRHQINHRQATILCRLFVGLANGQANAVRRRKEGIPS